MLVSFAVENYRSFDAEQTFLMTPAARIQGHEDHVYAAVPECQRKALLSIAAIYGANASGKSNLIKALQFAKAFVVRGSGHPDDPIPVEPFRLREGAVEEPCRFDFVIIHEGVQYQYGFAVNREVVCEEWLFARPLEPRKQETRWFERVTHVDAERPTLEVEFGAALKKTTSDARQFLEFVVRGCAPNDLLLTELYRRGVEEIRPLVSWFDDVLKVIGVEEREGELFHLLDTDERFGAFASDFLRGADTGIEAIRVMDEPNVVVTVKGGPTLNARKVGTTRRGADGHEVEFSIHEESDGTRRLAELLMFLYFMSEHTSVLVLDELDRRMHTALSRFFVEYYFKRCLTDDAPSQFIFTTHDTNLLDQSLLRRDEVWFMEKKDHATRFYSLAEFRIRNDLEIERGYLQGRFGAIPFLGDPARLGLVES